MIHHQHPAEKHRRWSSFLQKKLSWSIQLLILFLFWFRIFRLLSKRKCKWSRGTEVIVEWSRETEVLTKRGFLETKNRMTQLTNWKKKAPEIIQKSSVRLLNNISNKTDMNHIIRVAKKKVPALLLLQQLPLVSVLQLWPFLAILNVSLRVPLSACFSSQPLK